MKTDLATVNQYDKDGNCHGRWVYYFGSGERMWKGGYRHGSAHGLWERYQKDGKPIYKGEYKEAKRIGLWYDDRY
jgi:antitoxin component YwqK of YwqJK toxin-antitoxin module